MKLFRYIVSILFLFCSVASKGQALPESGYAFVAIPTNFFEYHCSCTPCHHGGRHKIIKVSCHKKDKYMDYEWYSSSNTDYILIRFDRVPFYYEFEIKSTAGTMTLVLDSDNIDNIRPEGISGCVFEQDARYFIHEISDESYEKASQSLQNEGIVKRYSSSERKFHWAKKINKEYPRYEADGFKTLKEW